MGQRVHCRDKRVGAIGAKPVLWAVMHDFGWVNEAVVGDLDFCALASSHTGTMYFSSVLRVRGLAEDRGYAMR